MSDMTLAEAWRELGFDPDGIASTISRQPRSRRVEAAEKLAEAGRKAAKKLFFVNHPDRGGDPARFKRIQEAVKVIEAKTAEFRETVAELERRAAERAEKGPFIEIKK